MEPVANPAESAEVAILVEEIHRDFKTASERLYNEAVALIEQIKVPDEGKIERLKKLGFVQSKEVITSEKELTRKKELNLLKDRIKYYHDHYPLYKFITESSVKELCNKYGLVYGKASQFVGFVPEKNLREMENFEIDPTDMLYIDTQRGMWGNINAPISYIAAINFCRAEVRNVSKSKTTMEERLQKAFNKRFVPIVEFQVAAPKTDFRISDREEIKDHRIVEKPIPDPVILFPVMDGFLIVTAWGPEASDPLVVNEIHN